MKQAKTDLTQLTTQMNQTNLYVRKLESELNEQEETNSRVLRDQEIYKKKYQEAKIEAQTAYKGLENYQVILAKFEENLQIALTNQKAAEQERDKAFNEVRIVR